MNAVSISLLVCSIWPTLAEFERRPWPVGRAPRVVLSPRMEAAYKQLWGGPVDPFGLTTPHVGADEWRDAFRPGDARLGGAPAAARSRHDDGEEAPTWTAHGFREDDIRRSLGRQFDLDWAKLNSKIVLIDPNANPYIPIRRSGWQADESVKMPLPGSLFVVGQLRANSGSIEYQQYELMGRTGLGMRLPQWLGGEIQVRGGRSKANYDPDDESMFPGRVTTFVELVTKWPVFGRLNLEYTGKAIPAPTPNDRDVVRQELKFAVPFTDYGQFHVGARYRWEDAATQSPWHDRMNMFIGLQMKR